MKRVPPYPGVAPTLRRMSRFEALARAIVYQQLATAAAHAIYGRVRDLTPGPRFPRPGELVALPQEALRGAGLSKGKMRALLDLAHKVENGALDLRSIHRFPDDEVTERLTAVWGVGEWTAQMFLIFKLGRRDVMPAGDLGIREGVRVLDGLAERPTPAHVLERSEPWRPLRSVASWVLWRLLEEER